MPSGCSRPCSEYSLGANGPKLTNQTLGCETYRIAWLTVFYAFERKKEPDLAHFPANPWAGRIHRARRGQRGSRWHGVTLSDRMIVAALVNAVKEQAERDRRTHAVGGIFEFPTSSEAVRAVRKRRIAARTPKA